MSHKTASISLSWQTTPTTHRQCPDVDLINAIVDRRRRDTTFTLTANAQDFEDGELSANIQWNAPTQSRNGWQLYHHFGSG